MAGRRIGLHFSIAIAALAGGAPLAAQSTNNVAATTTPPPAASSAPATAPATAPSGTAIGPPQLRDFSLGGTVTRPAETVATPPPAGAARPPAASAPVTPPPAPRQRAAPAGRAPDPVSRDEVAPPSADERFPSVTPPISSEVPLAPSPVPEPAIVPATDSAPDTGLWPWIAAGLAVALGGGFLWWRRQQDRPSPYAAERGNSGSVAPRDSAPPTPRPAPRPVEPAARRPSASPAPSPRPAPAPAPTPAPAPAAPPPTVAPPIPGGIVASGLKPRIEFELVPLRVEIDAAQGAAVTVEVVVINRGSAPARDVLVEAQLINAGPDVDSEVGRFFQRPAGSGHRLALISPMSSVSVQLRLTVDAAGLAPLVIDGRKLLVPLVAINAFYRWSGGELSDSASFLVGRGDTEAAKLAPFRLDLGARHWSSLAARLHSNGLQRR